MADFRTFVTSIFNAHDSSKETLINAVSSSAAETAALGAEIGAALQKGAVVALEGGLGTGKTCLAGGIAAALGVHVPVTSPTYTIVNEYEGDFCTFYHVDAYRLSGTEDFFLTCGGDFFDGGGIYVVEWPEKIPEALPPQTVCIKINLRENGEREFQCSKYL